jgi:integrase
MPQFLCDEIQDYLKMLYELGENDRIFPLSKSFLHHEMDRGAEEAGVKRIRIHDLRHSAISYLIELGFSALAIAERVGHESIDITYHYYGKKNLMTSCTGRCRDLLKHLPEQLFIINVSVH